MGLEPKVPRKQRLTLMQEQERDTRELQKRIRKLPCMWTHIRLRAVIGEAGERWVLLGLHADLVCEEPQETLDLSDVNIPETVKLIEDIRPFSDFDTILSGIGNGELNLRDVPVMIYGFKGPRTILVRGHYEEYLLPPDVTARWTDSWPSLVFSLGCNSLKDIGFDEEAVNRELATGDFDHQALYELTRDVIGFQLGGTVRPHIYIVAPIYITLSSAISLQRISFVVRTHQAVHSSDIRVRIAESLDSQRFRRSITADAVDTQLFGMWKNHAHNLKRPKDVNSIVMRLIFRGEQIDHNFQNLEIGTGSSYLIQPWQNVKTADSLLGIVEFRYPAWGDDLWAAQQLDEQDSRTFTCQVLAHQMVQTNPDVGSLCSMDDARLIFLAQHFVEGVDTLRSEFERNAGASYFDDFCHLFEKRLQSVRERIERTQKSMEALVSSHISQVIREISEGPWRQILESMRTQQEQIRQLFLPASQLTLLGELLKDATHPVQEALQAVQFPSYHFDQIIAPPTWRVPHLMKETEEFEEDLLDQLLSSIDPNLVQMRNGAWQTFRGDSSDSLRQSFHSMRELVREVFEFIAPDDRVQAAPWYERPQSDAPVTRKQRVRFALTGNSEECSKSDTQRLSALWQLVDDGVDAIYGQLNSVAHGRRVRAAESYLHLAEELLTIVLTNRKGTEGLS